MKLETNNLKLFRFSNQRQIRIHRRLLLISPGSGAFYRDACRLMETDPPFSATTHLVSHLLREIESSLRKVLKSYIKSEEEPPKEGNKVHVWEIREILKGLEIQDDNSIAEAWLQLPRSNYSLDKQAHREDLGPPRSFNENYRQFWDKMESVLDMVLESFEARYLESHYMLDELLLKTSPSLDDAKWLRLNAPNNLVSLGYFFNKLTSTEWLEPLMKEGLFKRPPEPEQEIQDERILINYSPWAQSRYLARMAATGVPNIQQMVLEIMLQIQTENFLVHLDIIDAACSFPPQLAVPLAAKEMLWIEQQNMVGHLLPEKLGTLVVHLAKGGQIEAALALTRVLLSVMPNPKAKKETEEDIEWSFRPEPISRIELWDYERLLGSCIPILTEGAGQPTLNLLTDLLETAISLSRRPNETTGRRDYSEIWRRGIEHHDNGLKNLLVSAVRDSSEQILKADPTQLPEIINFLESHQWLLFKRLALHLLRMFPENAKSLIVERLVNKDNFDNPELWHEYITLLRESFSRLERPHQDKVLGWIDEAPDIETVKKRQEKWDGKLLTDEQAEQIIKGQKLRRLEPIRDVLPEAWKIRYKEWTAKIGRPEHTEYTTPPIQFRMGFGSPRNTEDLRSMEVDEIVNFLFEWEPTGSDLFDQSPEGLGRELSPLIASAPLKFATVAESFQALDPTYVRAFISGIKSAVSQSLEFPWDPVLRLCDWVMNQPREIPGRKDNYQDRDIAWTATRAEIADLLTAGFKSDTVKIPFHLRTDVWRLLKLLTEDPQPTPEYEAEYGGSNMDPATLSLNTIRGEAMRGLIQYAFWVKYFIDETDISEERKPFNFDDIPEVREVLDLHLNPEQDTSLAIRSIYGESLPWLISLDQSWIQDNLTRIFPKEENLWNLYSATWGSYVIFNQPYNNVYDLLQEEYRYAIQNLGKSSPYDKSHLTHPDKKLAEHLIWLYLQGKLNIEDSEGLISQFYENASDNLRGYIFWVVGRDFEQADSVPKEILEKFRTLVDYRISEAHNSTDNTTYISEMRNFGWVFSSKKFDNNWSITQLKQTLDIARYSELDSLVIEHLDSLANDFPTLVVDCVSIMVEGVDKKWKINYWDKHLKNILSIALKTAARETATILINKLAARGFLEFKDLI